MEKKKVVCFFLIIILCVRSLEPVEARRDPLELELQEVVRCQVGARNPI